MSPKKKAPKKKAKPQPARATPRESSKPSPSAEPASATGNRRLMILLPVLLLVCVATIWLRFAYNEGGGVFAADARVFFLGPDEYYMNRGAYLQDEQGATVADTVLLPEIPASIDDGSQPSDGGYVGPDACAECHQEKHSTFVHTSHAKTSAFPSRETILGKIAAEPDGEIAEENMLKTQSPNLRVEMIERDGQILQRLVVNTATETVGSEFPFDVVTGSGKIGQTYLYFENEHLYQLHASYLSSTDRWMNSPGYLDGAADFARPILSACLECHTTYAQPYAGSANQYHREHMVLGVTCEKCHGPGKEHVTFHQANPNSKAPHAIVNPASMSAERSLELCQLCHGGDPIVEKQPPFSYRPGKPLSDFYEYAQADGSKAVSGIHTNTQLPRLKRSKCFELSESMTCLDCHNPHQFERGNMKLFSQRCLNCHEMPDCGKFESFGESLADNCIDCHMQNLDMNDIKLISGDTKFVPKMRDHFITVWPEVSEAYERELNKANP